MAVNTNYLTPTSFKPPPHGKGTLYYRVKTFGGYTDPALMDADVNAFFDSLNVNGLPWPHIVSVEHNVYPKADNPGKDDPLHFTQVTYLLAASP